MNRHLLKYLTCNSPLLRNWVKERIYREDIRFEVIEGDIEYVPEETQYVRGEIDITGRRLKKIDRKVIFCEFLFCWNNQLSELPELPVCRLLICSSNRLTRLPELPVCESLICHHNQLASLPRLPVCTHLDCSDNRLPAGLSFSKNENNLSR